jgi:hypothetical protein
MRVKQFGNHLAIGSDYFMATAKHLVTWYQNIQQPKLVWQQFITALN